MLNKHIHILGICGTFMGGIAAIAKEAGYRVTGCDAKVHPPMSTQLETLGIEVIEGFDEDQTLLNPDIYIIGNVVKRGMPLIEAILNQGLPYISGPQWLAENVLSQHWVLGVAGTHGKTTTASMLAWILEYAGLNPGFLIGGVPENFLISARLSTSFHDKKSPAYFVIEADEYDTAFFDKRSKFIHYRPKTAVLNNLEFDHADIFANLAAIQTQFHHFIRTIPSNGLIVNNGADQNLSATLALGSWTPIRNFSTSTGWHHQFIDANTFDIFYKENKIGSVHWDLLGEHNRQNALAAIVAAEHVGIAPSLSMEALGEFKSVKRRMETKGIVNGITIYDDFAHHPTAIELTLSGLRSKIGNQRIIAILEPRSNTMKLGTMKTQLANSLKLADIVYCYSGGIDWDVAEALKPLGEKTRSFKDFNDLLKAIQNIAQTDDHILIMSNGGFQGIHDKLLTRLK